MFFSNQAGYLLTTEYFYDQVGNKIRQRDAGGKETTYEYDLRDHLKKSINPALEATSIDNTFDGRVLSQSDGENHKTSYEYDADRKLSKNIDGNGNAIDLAYGGSTGTGCTDSVHQKCNEINKQRRQPD